MFPTSSHRSVTDILLLIQLDLHGVSHERAKLLVENFVLLNNLPLRIVTGNSIMMRNIVIEITGGFGLKCDFENDWNLGAFIIKESDE